MLSIEQQILAKDVEFLRNLDLWKGQFSINQAGWIDRLYDRYVKPNHQNKGAAMPTEKDLDNRFTYHKPTGNQPSRYTEIRRQAGDLARFINLNCPESRELSLAITRLEEAVMWANAAIARNDNPTHG
jgi:hypothetical protein